MKTEKPDIECTSLKLFWKDIKKSLFRDKLPANLFIFPLISAIVFTTVVDGLVHNSILSTITFGLVFMIHFFIGENRLEKDEIKRDKEQLSNVKHKG